MFPHASFKLHRGCLVPVVGVVEEAAAKRDRVLRAQWASWRDGPVILIRTIQVGQLGERLPCRLRGWVVVEGDEAVLDFGDYPVGSWDVTVERVGEFLLLGRLHDQHAVVAPALQSDLV
jgi:hypothetical protein